MSFSSIFNNLANIVNTTVSALFRRFFDLDDPAVSTFWTTTTVMGEQGVEEEEVVEEVGGGERGDVAYVDSFFFLCFDCLERRRCVSYVDCLSLMYIEHYIPNIIFFLILFHLISNIPKPPLTSYLRH